MLDLLAIFWLKIRTRVVSTINSAVLGASLGVRAVLGAPLVAGEAVGVSADVVGPSPVGVKHN